MRICGYFSKPNGAYKLKKKFGDTGIDDRCATACIPRITTNNLYIVLMRYQLDSMNNKTYTIGKL
jgi:hypothetical protein